MTIGIRDLYESLRKTVNKAEYDSDEFYDAEEKLTNLHKFITLENFQIKLENLEGQLYNKTREFIEKELDTDMYNLITSLDYARSILKKEFGLK